MQLYLSQPAAPATPSQVLRSFERVQLLRGEQRVVEFTLTVEDLSRWSVRGARWHVPRGRYRVAIGSSSRDIRAHDTFRID